MKVRFVSGYSCCYKSKRNAPALRKSLRSGRRGARWRGVLAREAILHARVCFTRPAIFKSLRLGEFSTVMQTLGILVKSVVKVAIKVCSFCGKCLFLFMIKILENSELKRNYWNRTAAMYPGIKLSENV